MNIRVNVTPQVVNGQTKWTLDVVDNGQGGKGGKGGFGHYPDVNILKGHPNELMTYTITDGGTWQFAADPLWVSTGSQDPSTPSSVPDQIDPKHINVNATRTELSFVDSNGKQPITLHYTLNFRNGPQTSSTLDPIINNGGPGLWGGSGAEIAWLAIGGIIIALIILWAIRKRK